MKSVTLRRPLFFVCLTFGLMAAALPVAAAPPVNGWSGMSSLEFKQGFVRNACRSQPACQADDLVFGENLSVHCTADVSNGFSCSGSVASFVDWRLGGMAGHFPGPPPADVPVTVSLGVAGELISS